MAKNVSTSSFISEMSREGHLKQKIAAGWATTLILSVPLAIGVMLGLPQKIAFIFLVVATLPINYALTVYFGKSFELKKHRARKGLPIPSKRGSVADDWIRSLPSDKSALFESIVRNWEGKYAIASVALDDAFSLRAEGKPFRESLETANLWLRRLSASVITFCDFAARRARYIPGIPQVEPLRSEFFRGDLGQSAASWNNILHHVLFVGRLRFLQKLRILSTTIEELQQEFDASATETIVNKQSDPANDAWKSLDALHYDLSTCLREAEIVLKSFLRALPKEDLETLTYVLAELFPEQVSSLEIVSERRRWLRLTYGLSCENIVLRSKPA